MREVGATNEILEALTESQIKIDDLEARVFDLEDELALTSDELTRLRSLFQQYQDAVKSGRRDLKKRSLLSRLFS